MLRTPTPLSVTFKVRKQALDTHGHVKQFIPFFTDMDPSYEDIEELLLSCRYGDLDDLKSFVQRFGTNSVGEARDENGNTVLHMASANGHIGEKKKTIHPPCDHR